MRKSIHIFAVIFKALLLASAAIAAHNAIIVHAEKKDEKRQSFYEKYIKRPLDFFLASGALVVLSPLLILTALLVKVKLGSPVLFTQFRPGLNGKTFRLFKFRTMSNERGKDGELLPDKDRLTKFGKRLRATSVDELPELINIVKGDMAVVGPRPLAEVYLPYYTKEERHRHDARPGLTGLAQINGRNDLSWEKKIQYDLDYIKSISFKRDLSIIVKTVKKVLTHEGIGQGENSPVSLHVERSDWEITQDGAIKPAYK